MKESVSNVHDFSFHFSCLDHPTEEYVYYSATTKKLYCAQCLLSDNSSNKPRDLKPIKRCLPIITQHFQDLMNNVEVNRGLMSNRKRDAEIKIADLQSRMQSMKNNFEIKFDELVDKVQYCKEQFLDGFQSKAVSMVEEVQELTEQFDEKLEYLEAILDQVKQIQEVRIAYLDRKPRRGSDRFLLCKSRQNQAVP